MAPDPVAREEISSGRCVDISPGRHLDVPLYWQRWRVDSNVMTALTAAVTAAARAALT